MKLNARPGAQKCAAAAIVLCSVALVSLGASATAAPAAPAAATVVAATSLDTVITLDVKEAPATDAFRMIAKFAGLSLVADATVKGNVTADLKGNTVRESLDLLTSIYGWAWNRVGNTIVVGDPARVKPPVVAAPVVEVVAPPPTVVSFVAIKNASAADVAQKLSLVIAPSKVTVDSRTNMLIIQATQAEIDSAKSLIAVLDMPVAAPVAAKPAITTRVKISAIGGAEGSYLALVTVDGKSFLALDGDKLADDISVVKVGADQVTFSYAGDNVVVGTEGSVR